MDNQNTVICPNCGATVRREEDKCSFCGYINIAGAEKKYLDDVRQVEEHLGDIPQEQKEEIQKHIFKNGKIILFTVLIVLLLLGTIMGIMTVVNSVLIGKKETDPKAVAVWKKQNYPLLDEMYEEKRYDDLLEFEMSLYGEEQVDGYIYSLYEWEHYGFLSEYGDFHFLKSNYETLSEEAKPDIYTVSSILFYGLHFFYGEYEESAYLYTEEELELLESYREYAIEVLTKRMQYTNDEIDEIYRDVTKDGYLSINACDKYAKQYIERMK